MKHKSSFITDSLIYTMKFPYSLIKTLLNNLSMDLKIYRRSETTLFHKLNESIFLAFS